MANIISGKDLSDKLKQEMKDEMPSLISKYGRCPHLVVILVGQDPASISYVTGKEKACNFVGIKNTTIKFSDTISEKELLEKINELNLDDSVDGILVQLPLPAHINKNKIIDAVSINKDVDGFHPLNVAGLWLKREVTYPCTPKGIMRLLDSANVTVDGKNCCVIGRSNIVGMPVAKMLLDRNATVTVCHSHTKNLKTITENADILVVAIGKPRFVTSDMVKEGVVIIDVGVNRLPDGKLCGDVDFDNVVDKVSAITKVPGGVGPMTICSLLENTIEIYKKHFEK